MATDHDYDSDHGNWGRFAVLTFGTIFGFCSIAVAVLALLVSNPDLLCRADSARESLVAEKVLDLATRRAGTNLSVHSFVYEHATERSG